MENENLTDNNKEESVLLKEYQKLQENSVSKEKYEADMNELKQKNELYLKAITEGSKIDAPDNNSGSLEESIADLTNFKGTNLAYWQKTNSAIDQVLKEVPRETIVAAIKEDGLQELIKVNEGMRKMVEESEGDADYFRSLYKRKIEDKAPLISNEINKAGGLVNYLENRK